MHMAKAMVHIDKRLKVTDVILEVRDARAPFSTAQHELLQRNKSLIACKQRVKSVFRVLLFAFG